MNKITKPEYNLDLIIDDCVSNMQSEKRINDYKTIKNDLNLMAEEYDRKGSEKRLFDIAEHSAVGGISKSELIKLYNSKFSKLGQLPRGKYYDKIRSAAPLNICPLCMNRVVSTVDHILPKSFYPGFSVTPYNLVPACKDCNTDKKEFVPKSDKEVHLHPYYDDVQSERWLFVEVLETNPITFNYVIKDVEGWSGVLMERIKKHFEIFNLNILYSIHAASELQSLTTLVNVRNTGGTEQVKYFLETLAIGKLKKHKNHWQTAFYSGLSESDWFCNEGVLTLE